MNERHRFALRAAVCAALLSLYAPPTRAATPATVLLEGAIHAQGGGPAADGKYNFTFAIYDKAAGGTAIWSEGPVTINTVGGRFSWALGSNKAFDVAKLAAAPGHYLGIRIGSDPELPRQPMHSTAFALHASSAAGLTCTGCIGSAQIAAGSINAAKLGFYYAASDKKGGPALKARALDCTGCVGVAQLRFDKSVNLGGQALSKVGKLTVDGEILAQGTVSAQSFIGDGSKLTGIKTPAGDCPSGQVVWGVDAGGQLKCKQVGGALDAVSGGNMDNHFDDVITGAGAGTAVPDFNNNGLLAKLTMPDIGTALALEVYVEIDKKPIVDINPKDGKPDNDISDLTVILLPPATKALPSQRGNAVNNFSTKPTIDGKVFPHYVLHQNTGKGLAALIATYPTQTKPAQGSLGEWIGKNPKGTWKLFVLDNNDRVDAKGKDLSTDGHLVGWHMKIRTVSGKQLTVKGSQFVHGTVWGPYKGHDGQQLGGDLQVGAGIKVGNTQTKCDATAKGTIRWNDATNGFEGCDGKGWVGFSASVGTQTDPGKTCKDIKWRNAGASDGFYIIDPDGKGKGLPPFRVYCDMTRDGGGWMLGIKHWYRDQLQQWGMWGQRTGDMNGIHQVRGFSFSLSDAEIRAAMGGGKLQSFDVMFDQVGINKAYSYRNMEYVILRNYTANWTFTSRMPESKTVTQAESWSYAGELLWKGRPKCGNTHSGGRGINCLGVYPGSTRPRGGRGCKKNYSRNRWADKLELYMNEYNTDTYMYVCNGAQHSSSYTVNHRYWFRERN